MKFNILSTCLLLIFAVNAIAQQPPMRIDEPELKKTLYVKSPLYCFRVNNYKTSYQVESIDILEHCFTKIVEKILKKKPSIKCPQQAQRATNDELSGKEAVQ